MNRAPRPAKAGFQQKHPQKYTPGGKGPDRWRGARAGQTHLNCYMCVAGTGM